MEFDSIINGDFVASAERSQNINPSDLSDVVGLFARADRAVTNQAIEAAAEAFPSWSATTPQLRHDILKRASDLILQRVDTLGRALSREEGKTLAEGMGEATRAGQVFAFFAGECLRAGGEQLPSTRPGVGVTITREALGVVGLITPWNFPIAIPAWKIAPALAWGNTVVLKPAEIAPHSAWLLVQILAEAGLPKGVLNLVLGKGSVVGEALVEHPKVAAISFTGSVNTGRRIAQGCTAALPMKKVQLEMGGKNPLVVLDDADLDLAVEAALNGAFYSTGQRCTASSRLIVTKGIHDAFVARLSERMQALVVGHALDAKTQIGPVVDQNQFEIDLGYIARGTDEGARLIGGEVVKAETEGYFLRPALFTEADNAMAIAREEIFGPVACVIAVDDFESAMEVANDTDFGLSSGICTTSLKNAEAFKRRSGAGMAMVNLPTAGVDYHVPFGGRKGSSYGSREQGTYARDFYSAVKTAYTLA